ncbi:MAG: hypothetical protein LBQ95_06410 [Lachnospiraceae bacterium]|jgi:pimeloyl-ACP methyl ester carboxylesterase|nr:hypothetical protein [Lachnospiraceae bacterium]
MENHKPELMYHDITLESSVEKLIKPSGLEDIEFDENEFHYTQIGRKRRELTSLYHVYKDIPLHPFLLRYWAKLGLKKELFDASRDEGKYAYSVFTPLDMDPNKKYALIYYCHGGDETIGKAETSGFNMLAAVEKYIVVYAQNGGNYNEEVDTEFARIMGELRKKGYPVDWSRVYAAGFGNGGSAAVCAACTYPDMVAAVAVLPGGNPFLDLQFYKGLEYYASTKGKRIPGIFIGGTIDKNNFPAPWITEYSGNELGAGSIENAVSNLEIWLKEIAQAGNNSALSYEDIKESLVNSEDPIKKEFGLNFDRAYAFRAQSVDWLGGDYFGTDGAPVMRFVRAIGMPHEMWDNHSEMTRGGVMTAKWYRTYVVTESEANIVWDYLKRFSRDKETCESLYSVVNCWGES